MADVDPTVDIDDELEMLEDDVVVVIPGASVLELVVTEVGADDGVDVLDTDDELELNVDVELDITDELEEVELKVVGIEDDNELEPCIDELMLLVFAVFETLDEVDLSRLRWKPPHSR